MDHQSLGLTHRARPITLFSSINNRELPQKDPAPEFILKSARLFTKTSTSASLTQPLLLCGQSLAYDKLYYLIAGTPGAISTFCAPLL